MRLRLNMCDVDFQIKIKGWRETPSGEYDCDQWTRDEFYLKGKYIDYFFDSEVLLSDEVVYLRNALKNLLDGTLKEDCIISFAEPDFEFRLSPAKRLYSEPGKIIYRDGYIDVDIDMDMIIHFWCEGGLGTNQFSMTFDRGEIKALYTYLQLVTKEISAESTQVKQYIASGVFLPE